MRKKDKVRGVDGQSARPGKRYQSDLARLQVELSHLQAWVQSSGARINCITHLLNAVPCERLAFEAPALGKRQRRPKDFVADESPAAWCPMSSTAEQVLILVPPLRADSDAATAVQPR